MFAVTIALLSLVKPNVSGNYRDYKPGKIVGVEPDYQQNHDMKAVSSLRRILNTKHYPPKADFASLNSDTQRKKLKENKKAETENPKRQSQTKTRQSSIEMRKVRG